MIEKRYFDSYGGQEVSIYILRRDGLEVGVTDFGAAVQYIKLIAPSGEKNICLGYPTIAERLASGTYCGATVGRVANRIADARFSLDGREYFLEANDGKNCNHGGKNGFDRRLFGADICGESLRMELFSPDGDQGFPANLRFCVEFALEDGGLTVSYTAQSDGATLWAPTCHTYFNLSGGGSSTDALLKINASAYTPVNASLIPEGDMVPVKNTPFDFTDFKPIGRDLDAEDKQLAYAGGYDHNFVLQGAHAACAVHEGSGIKLDVYTDMPGLQLYSGNFIRGTGVNGRLNPRDGFCLEPQFFPDAVNSADFAKPVLRGGTKASHFIRYKFGTL